MAEKALFIMGAELDQLANGTADPDVLLGVEVEWDKKVQSWRADWEGGVQFGDTKIEAAINAFKQRLVR